MNKKDEQVEAFIPFKTPEEALAYMEYMDNIPYSQIGEAMERYPEKLPGYSGAPPEEDSKSSLLSSRPQNNKMEIDLAKAIEALNRVELEPNSLLPNIRPRSVSPLPTLPSDIVAAPKYRESNRTKITAAGLKNKVLSCYRMVVKRGIAYIFDGRCYQALDISALKQLISAVCWAELNEYGRYDIVTGAINFILSEPSIQLYDDVQNRRILTFQNGNLDIDTGEFSRHTPNVFTTYTLQCNYISDTGKMMSPLFDKLLEDISGGDAGIKMRIREAIGYCLVPDIGGKTGFVLQGRKHSGKSLLCNYLESFFPQNVVSALDVHDFSQQFALSELEGKMLCVSSDMPQEQLNNRVVGNIKKLSGNDLISAPKKHMSNRQFRFGGKLVLVSNHQVTASPNDDAFWDRLMAIPFPFTVPPEAQDINLLESLLQEKDAVASKAIRAFWQLRERSYRFSGSYEINSGSFLVDGSENVSVDIRPVIQAFLLDNYESAPYSEEGVFMSDAHALYEEKVSPIAVNRFGELFGNVAIGILGARKTRRRKPGENNPTSYLEGIRPKGTATASTNIIEEEPDNGKTQVCETEVSHV